MTYEKNEQRLRWEHYVRRRDWTDIRRKLIPIIANAAKRQLTTVLPSEVKTDELTKRKLVMLKLAKENTFVKTLSMSATAEVIRTVRLSEG
ncbi:MAG: hypothetical protein ACTS5A_01465 [Candidatus Hodgkinia cicadicola]